jgi:hypothetical protein
VVAVSVKDPTDASHAAMTCLAQCRQRFGPFENLLNAFAPPSADRVTGWRVVRTWIAEHRTAGVLATCGLELRSRNAATKPAVPQALSAPTVMRR